MVFEELFSRRTVNGEKALMFGFIQTENGYKYETDILNSSFFLQIAISSSDIVDTILTDKATNEEYILYKTNAVGSFVGEVEMLSKPFSLKLQINALTQKSSSHRKQKKSLSMFVRNTVTSLSFYGKSSPIMRFGEGVIAKNGTVQY